MCVGALHVCAPRIYLVTLGIQKKVLNALELELQMTVSHHLSAEAVPSIAQEQVLFIIELALQTPAGFFRKRLSAWPAACRCFCGKGVFLWRHVPFR